MTTKIFNGNKYVTSFECNGTYLTKTQRVWFYFRRAVKRVILTLALFSLVGWGFVFGGRFMPVTVYADKEVIKEIEVNAPVMDRISKCESGNRQFGVNGQVLVKVNTNGSTDTGYYQINSIWGAQATKLKYNLSIEKDNKDFAMYLYKNYGTQPWYSSLSCWNK